jgi:signal transduction histidine kinase/CheY-like chemotaxis protein
VAERLTENDASPDRLDGLELVRTGGQGIGDGPPGDAAQRSAILNRSERECAEDSLAERTRQLEAVRTISEEITRELDLKRLLQLILHRTMEFVGASTGVIRLWDGATQMLVPSASQDEGRLLWPLRLGEGVSGTVAQRRQGMIVNDFRKSPYATPRHLEHTTFTAILAEPLLYRDRLVGVIAVGHKAAGGSFRPEEAQLLRLFATQAAIAIENARLFAELKCAYADLSRAQDELVRSEKLRALGQMAAGIAHDLNNILSTILGQTSLLRLRSVHLPFQDALNTLELAATDAAEVVRRLQEFARQQAQRPLGPVDLAALVREALEITRPRWKDDPQQRGIAIETHLALGELPPVLGHASEIREALTNLILNAVDAMPHGGTLRLAGQLVESSSRQLEPNDAGAVDSTQQPPDRSTPWVELTVEDSGVGMTAEVCPQIFDPFFTTKGVKGTGLGLSVVYGIMQRHGGQIDVASSPGQGTTFTLRFRVAAGVPEAPAPSAGGRAVPPLRILLIDDDPSVRRTMADLLQEVGHSVVVAEGGTEGLAHLGRGRVDLVITDLGMPGITGWEVARAVKSVTPHPPIILLTGWGERPASHSEHAALVDRILGKPVGLHDLLSAIRDLAGPASRSPEVTPTNPASP